MRHLKIYITIIITFFSSTVSANISSLIPSNLIDNLSNRTFEMGISIARLFSEITYKDLRFDTNLDTIFISDLKFAPFALNLPKGCKFNVGTLSITSSNSSNSSESNFSIGMSNVDISKLCLDLQTRKMFAMAGVSDLKIPYLKFDIGHNYKTANSTIAIYGKSKDLASFTLAAEFSYLSATTLANDYSNNTNNNVFPFIGKLKNAYISIENNGLWENISTQMPKQLVTSGIAGPTVAVILSEKLNNILGEDATEELTNQVSNSIDEFIENPKSIILKTQIKSIDGIYLNTELFKNTEVLFKMLNPKIVINKNNTDRSISKADLNLIIKKDFSIFEINRLIEIASALNTGNGATKNQELAKSIYEFIATDNYEIIHEELINIYLSQNKYTDAYILAQKVAISEKNNLSALLNIIEKNLTLSEIINLQSQSVRANTYEITGKHDPYNLARRYLAGDRKQKSFENAYFWSIIAKSEGDTRADFIIEKIESFEQKLQDPVNWIDRINRIQSDALQYWINSN